MILMSSSFLDRNLLQLCESRAVEAPFGGVLQVLAQRTGQRSENRIQVLHGQLGAAEEEEEEKIRED